MEGTEDEVVTVVKGDVVALEVKGVGEVLGQHVELGEEERAAHQMNASLQKEQIEVQQNLSWATTIVRTNCF